jgi:hypothetical protein
MGKFVLLLDIDGVVMRNKRLLKNVKFNCTKFVQTHSNKPMGLYEAYQKNHMLHKNYGHTLRGLNYTVDKGYFNNQVYDKRIYNELDNYLNTSEFEDHINGFSEIYHICKKNDIPIGIFSNAPFDWCNRIVYGIEIKQECFIDEIYSNEHYAMTSYLKPDYEVYSGVEKDIKDKYGSSEIIMVDDSFINLKPIYNQLPWSPVLFKNEQFTKESIIPNISNMYELKTFLNTKINYNKLTTFNVYLIGKEVRNIPMLKHVIRCCDPYIMEKDLERIINETNNYGKGLIKTCNKPDSIKLGMCLIESGFDININENTDF